MWDRCQRLQHGCDNHWGIRTYNSVELWCFWAFFQHGNKQRYKLLVGIQVCVVSAGPLSLRRLRISHPVIVTKRNNQDYMGVLSYSYDTSIAGCEVVLNHREQLLFLLHALLSPESCQEPYAYLRSLQESHNPIAP